MIKLAVMFGGKSTEHNISVVSGTSILERLNKKRYQIFPIYIDTTGKFYKYTKEVDDIKALKIDEEITELEPIDNIFKYLEDIDVVFPVLHGLYGEDGTVQGFFELAGKKYVGCKTLSSALCMDKVYAKILFKTAGIDVAKSMYIVKEEDKYIYIDDNFNRESLNKESLQNQVEKYLKYPAFVKPSNSGSSVGVNRANNREELIEYLEEALIYDTKVLIEEAIIGREVECAVLGNNSQVASYVGEIISNEEFYSYNSKYKSNESITIIPTNIDQRLSEKIRSLAIKAYQACDCKGLSRVDFFIEQDTNRVIINEINTMPGFTEISMYPKLMEHLGYSYEKLLDTLIDLAK